jgi:hypothetical protein
MPSRTSMAPKKYKLNLLKTMLWCIGLLSWDGVIILITKQIMSLYSSTTQFYQSRLHNTLNSNSWTCHISWTLQEMYFKVYDDDVHLQRSSKSQQSADAMPETREGMTVSFVVFVLILFLYLSSSYLLSFCFFYYYSRLKHGLHLWKLSSNGLFPC